MLSRIDRRNDGAGSYNRGLLSRRLELVLMTALLVALFAALAYEAKHTGITADEPSHLLSAALYWRGADTLKPRDMPPLIKIVGGWPSRFVALPDLTADQTAWATQHEWLISQSVLRRMPFEELDRWVFRSRLALTIFPLLTVLLIWKWARELFSARVAITLAALLALEPTALGHGALFKNDHAATFAYLVFAYTAWRYWRSPTFERAAWLALAAVIGVLAKLSLLILPPAAVLLMIRRWKHVVAAIALMYALAVAACQFDFRQLSSREVAEIERDARISIPVQVAAHIARVIPVPRLLWDGVVEISRSSATPNPIWFWGGVRLGGHPAYFLVALLLKTPLALQGLLLCALISLIRVRPPTPDFWFVGIPALMYFTIASLSSLQFGVRLILPVLPFAILMCGFALQRWPLAWSLVAIAGVATSSLAAFPRGISYLNEAADGPMSALHFFSDSNIDWGQDLPALAEFVRREQVQKISVAYFGNDNIARWIPRSAVMLPIPWDATWRGPDHLKPAPGLYAVSACVITGQLFPPAYREYFAYFRNHRPVAVAGGSIFIYLVDYP